jgi:hypothetical protein
MGLIGCTLIIVLFALSGAEGAEWEKIGRHRGGSIYVDKQTIRESTKDTVTARIRVEVRAEAGNSSGDPKSLKEFLADLEYSCARQEYRILDLISYFMDGTSTTVQVPYGDIHYTVVPDTSFETAYNYLCKK